LTIPKVLNKYPVIIYSISALITCLLLNLGIFKDYAFRDAQEYIWTANKSAVFNNEFIQGGRFLLGLICEFVYGHLCTTISDLKWVRLFSLVVSVVFSTQVFSFLLKQKLKVYESALFSFLILTIPSFTVFIGWTATHEVPVVLNLSFLAGLILLKTHNKILNYFVAFILILICLCIYQPAATAFLIPFLITSIIAKEISLKKIISLVVFLGICFIAYFFIFKLSLNWYSIEPADRSEIDIIKLPIKVILFYFREVRMLLFGNGILILSPLFFILGIFSFFGFFYSIYKNRSQKQQFIILIAFLLLVLPLSYTPNLLSSGNFICSRAIAPAAIIVLFYQFYFLRELSLRKKTLKTLSLIFVFFGVVVSSINQNIYIAKIQNKEYNAIKKAFNKVPLDNKKKIIIIKPKEDFLQENKFYKRIHADEFSQVSSSRIWVPKPMFYQIRKERLDSLGLESKIVYLNDIEVVDSGDPYNNENSIIINLVDVLKKEFAKNN
jgi:hypothetical protein